MRILLLSGGMDSVTLLYRLISDDNAPDLCLAIDYGQPHIRETEQAGKICKRLGVPFEVAIARFKTTPNNGLLGGNDKTAEGSVVRGRNSAFISLAAMRGAATVILGCNADDQEAYIDCRTKVLKGVGKACCVSIELPFVGMEKQEIAAAARSLNVPIGETISCYRGMLVCRECAACIARADALAYPLTTGRRTA